MEMRLGHPTIPHLWILLTDPDPSTNLAVIVSVTSLKSYSDKTVVLKKGDHPYLTHSSVVSYGHAREYRVDKIEKMIASGWPLCDPCSDELLKAVQDGLLASPHTERRLKAVCQSAWNLEK